MLHSTLALVALLPAIHATRILYDYDPNLCLGVSSPANDAVASVYSCTDASVHLDWTFVQPGDNLSLQLMGTNFCLDAGTNPQDFSTAKVYTCYPGLAQQHWYFTADDRLALTGGTQCLDLDISLGGKGLQTYTCTTGNTHQIWVPAPAPTTTSVTTFTPAPMSTPSPTTVQYIHPNGNASQCLIYDGVYDGAFVSYDTCASTKKPHEFIIHQGDNLGIYVPGTNLCLTTTEDGAPFSELTVSYCRQDGNTHFYYTPDQRIAVTGGTTCLQNDVPYDGNQIEFRTCATGDNQQLFTLEDVQATITSTTAFPDPTTICHNGIQQILTPANYVNVTQTYPSGQIPFKYCSATNIYTSSLNITVHLAPQGSSNPYIALAVGSSASPKAGGVEYDLTLIVPKTAKPAAQSQLFVVEWINDAQNGGRHTVIYSQAVLF